jgi:hypothetical protein
LKWAQRKPSPLHGWLPKQVLLLSQSGSKGLGGVGRARVAGARGERRLLGGGPGGGRCSGAEEGVRGRTGAYAFGILMRKAPFFRLETAAAMSSNPVHVLPVALLSYRTGPLGS